MYQIYSLFIILVVTSIIGSLLYKSNIEHFLMMETLKGCETGPKPTISCPKGSVVSDVYVKYGRWDNTRCKHPTVNDKTTSSDMTFKFPSSYLGKQTVNWSDTSVPKLAGKDPLSGVYKHYELTPLCKNPDSSVQVSGCENTLPSELKCPNGSTVSAATIKYGRWNNDDCPHPTVNSGTTAFSKTYPVADIYLGKDNINWNGAKAYNIAGMQDPYPNVYKQYEINATCKYA